MDEVTAVPEEVRVEEEVKTPAVTIESIHAVCDKIQKDLEELKNMYNDLRSLLDVAKAAETQAVEVVTTSCWWCNRGSSTK
jgi:phage shock protein A